jgi:hypothetical protein
MNTDPWKEKAFSVLKKQLNEKKVQIFLEELRKTTINLNQDSKFKFMFKFNDEWKLKFPWQY